MQRVINSSSNLYPHDLEKTVLYYKGEIIWNNPALAIVGSRDCSAQAENKILNIMKSIPANVVIVSGLARGVDSIAHETAIKLERRTIAVLPCGIDIIYPRENISLGSLILEKGGMLVSEYKGTISPSKKSFILRNRIITGLSSAILVAEAKIKSGTMHAVNSAKKQRKIIYAIPGSEGTDFLISKGALDASNLPLIFKNDKKKL
jgi:DNA processing protein